MTEYMPTVTDNPEPWKGRTVQVELKSTMKHSHSVELTLEQASALRDALTDYLDEHPE